MDHKDLDIWKLSMDFTVKMYQLTELFPKSELYGMTSQIRRASASVPANIAEGASRKGSKELIQFLYISLGSLSEIETFIELSARLNYFSDKTQYINDITLIRKKLITLIRSIENKVK